MPANTSSEKPSTAAEFYIRRVCVNIARTVLTAGRQNLNCMGSDDWRLHLCAFHRVRGQQTNLLVYIRSDLHELSDHLKQYDHHR